MLLIPWLVRDLESNLPPRALAAALRAHVAKGSGTAFSGRVSPEGMTVIGMREYRSTFLPVISGRFTARGRGTAVHIRMRPPAAVIVFMGIWFLFLAVVSGGIVGLRLLSTGRTLLPLLLPAGLAGLSWHVMVGVFAADCRWALEHLLERVPELRRPGSAPRRGAPASKGGTDMTAEGSMIRASETIKGEPHVPSKHNR